MEPGQLLAGEYPGDPDPARARHKLDLLVDAGIRTFVDLNQPADRLEPYQPLVTKIAGARRLDVRSEQFPIRDEFLADHRHDEVVDTIQQGLARGAVYLH